MPQNDLESIDPNLDYSQILPIQQKRTIAFINSFIMNTVAFLNTFSQSCESQLLKFEHKLQKIEALLMILESQIASVPSVADSEQNETEINVGNRSEEPNNSSATVDLNAVDNKENSVGTVTSSETLNTDTDEHNNPQTQSGPNSADPIYQKFFKMLHVGVPVGAIRQKMEAEGIDPDIIHQFP